MPVRRGCARLHSLGVSAAANLLLSGCQRIDSVTDPFNKTGPGTGKPILSPSRDEVDLSLTERERRVKAWLGHLPDTVVEEVVTAALANLETKLLVDKDKKLILTLINIEKIKVNDFFFGIHSLLNVLRGFYIVNLNISKR